MKKYLYVLETSAIISILTLITYYVVGYWLASDGLSLMEFTLFSSFFGLCFLIYVLVINTYRQVSLKKEQLQSSKSTSYKWYQLLLAGIGFTFLCAFLLDTFYFYVVDNSLSLAFAEALEQVIKDTSPEQLASMRLFREMSPFTQNYVLNFAFILIGYLISVPLANRLAKSSSASAYEMQ